MVAGLPYVFRGSGRATTLAYSKDVVTQPPLLVLRGWPRAVQRGGCAASPNITKEVAAIYSNGCRAVTSHVFRRDGHGATPTCSKEVAMWPPRFILVSIF